jgi:SAM-dependent methyltransferase
MTVRWSMRPSTYDRMMRGSHQRRYYGDSGYFNFGYWGAGAKSQAEASEALVDQMVARIANKTGRILDVACGLGGSTKRLAQTYAPEMITGINISDAQIADARALAPSCTFQVMNATKLDFPNNRFDAVICIEGACHFDTRDKFLKESSSRTETGRIARHVRYVISYYNPVRFRPGTARQPAPEHCRVLRPPCRSRLRFNRGDGRDR